MRSSNCGKKVSNQSLSERGNHQQTHRYHTISHQLNPVDPILTGQYMRSEARHNPPKQLTEAMGMPVPPALQSAQQQAAQKQEADRG